MLLRFRFQNHRAFFSEQELSLIFAKNGHEGESGETDRGAAANALRFAAIYGANASGKTSVLTALAFMESAVRRSQKSWEPGGRVPREAFALDKCGREAPSLYEVDVLIDGVRYRYGFLLDDERIGEEWLYAYPNGKRQQWFTRKATDPVPFSFGKFLTGENKATEKLTRNNSLFLSAAAQNNHQLLLPIYSWFTKNLWYIGADSTEREMMQYRTAERFRDPKVLSSSLAFIQAADVGIVGVEIADQIPDEKLGQLTNAIQSIFKLKRGSNDNPQIPPKMSLRHRSSRPDGTILDFEFESKGTKAIIALLLPILDALEDGRTLCVDEMDASLHPILSWRLVNIFNDPKTNPKGAQLIISTHDTGLLKCKTVRRDQIWFTEKDKEGFAHLYPLTDFMPRTSENLERGYLQGRYGAIPFVGNLGFQENGNE